MSIDALEKLVDKSLSKEELFNTVEQDFDFLATVVEGIHSSKAAIRYGCGSVLIHLSEKHPEKMYPYFDDFSNMLESKYRILVWQAMAIIANLCCVDGRKKFDLIFDKYFQFIND